MLLSAAVFLNIATQCVSEYMVFGIYAESFPDEQALANDMVFEVDGADGKPLKLIRGPVQWDGEPTVTTRSPQASAAANGTLSPIPSCA